MSCRLSEKVCVVTGTGGSMGHAAAVAFAREGALVVGCEVAVEAAAETLEAVGAGGGQMVSLQPCRLSDPADCAKLVELAVSEFGTIDVLYNLAARSHFHRLEDFTDEEWAAAQQDEIDLVFYLTRAAWPHLKASHGVVVNMASLNGSLSFKLLPSLAHTTNKAAIIGKIGRAHRLNSSHQIISYAVFCLKKKKKTSLQAPKTESTMFPSKNINTVASSSSIPRAAMPYQRRDSIHRSVTSCAQTPVAPYKH